MFLVEKKKDGTKVTYEGKEAAEKLCSMPVSKMAVEMMIYAHAELLDGDSVYTIEQHPTGVCSYK